MHKKHDIDTGSNISIEIHRRLRCSERSCGIRIIHLAAIACSACFSVTSLLRAASISFVSHDLGLHDTVYLQSGYWTSPGVLVQGGGFKVGNGKIPVTETCPCSFSEYCNASSAVVVYSNAIASIESRCSCTGSDIAHQSSSVLSLSLPPPAKPSNHPIPQRLPQALRVDLFPRQISVRTGCACLRHWASHLGASICTSVICIMLSSIYSP